MRALQDPLAVVLALIVIGYWHFENVKMGIGAALLYLMLPYTAQMTGHVDHVLPAALLLWAVVLYRRPLLAGILIGAGGTVAATPGKDVELPPGTVLRLRFDAPLTPR